MRACHNCMHWPVCNMREDDNPCGYYKPQEKVAVKPITNADRIRAMSDEGLAYFLADGNEKQLAWRRDAERELIYWLKQPVKDGEGDN